MRRKKTGLMIVGLMLVLSMAARAATAPPNEPAKVHWSPEKGALRVSYNGRVILDGVVVAEDTEGKQTQVDVALEPKVIRHDDDRLEQRLRLTGKKPEDGVRLILRATVTASGEALPVETQGAAQRRFPLVRNSVGLSRNLRNNAVYDRHWDWLLSGPDDGGVRIVPEKDGREERLFSFHSRAPELTIVFRPRFYQHHNKVPFFEPWTYKTWKGPVTGYCTWWSYKAGFSQENLDEVAGVFAEKNLPDFGYHYIQLDNCYQIGNGSCPTNWLTWNGKFPGGPEYTIERIRSIGMKPGIWVHRIHRPNDPHVKEIAAKNPDWFVHKEDGSLFTANGFYVLDTTNEEAVDNMVRKLYRALADQGWDYVKIDGAGDLLNAYNKEGCDYFFENNPTTPELSKRKWDEVAREELGPDVYILDCWGVGAVKKSIGLIDGGRLAGDGFQPEKLANYNHYEGVVWRSDPDHCDILGGWLMDEDAMMPVFGQDEPVPVRTIVRPAICSIASGALMLSDKADVYTKDANIEGMKRSAPVLTSVPGQVYAAGHGQDHWWMQEIERPFEHWTVLTRMQWAKKRQDEWKFDLKGLPEQEVQFADLGLPSDRDYVVFEFWTQTYLGTFKGAFTAPAMDTNDGMDVFAIREARPHPWVIGTTRHLSQGGVSLSDVEWDAKTKTLSGKSAVVEDDPYVLTMSVPDGYRPASARSNGSAIKITKGGETAAFRIVPAATGSVEWAVSFK